MERREAGGRAHRKRRAGFEPLLTGRGIGQIVGRTLRWETGASGRVVTVGDLASSYRWVGSTKLSTGNRQGQGTGKNGNPSRAWAFVEAANCAGRSKAQSTRVSQRKQAKTKGVGASKAGAHQWARAGEYIFRAQVPFALNTAFASGPEPDRGWGSKRQRGGG